MAHPARSPPNVTWSSFTRVRGEPLFAVLFRGQSRKIALVKTLGSLTDWEASVYSEGFGRGSVIGPTQVQLFLVKWTH